MYTNEQTATRNKGKYLQDMNYPTPFEYLNNTPSCTEWQTIRKNKQRMAIRYEENSFEQNANPWITTYNTCNCLSTQVNNHDECSNSSENDIIAGPRKSISITSKSCDFNTVNLNLDSL